MKMRSPKILKVENQASPKFSHSAANQTWKSYYCLRLQNSSANEPGSCWELELEVHGCPDGTPHHWFCKLMIHCFSTSATCIISIPPLPSILLFDSHNFTHKLHINIQFIYKHHK